MFNSSQELNQRSVPKIKYSEFRKLKAGDVLVIGLCAIGTPTKRRRDDTVELLDASVAHTGVSGPSVILWSDVGRRRSNLRGLPMDGLCLLGERMLAALRTDGARTLVFQRRRRRSLFALLALYVLP